MTSTRSNGFTLIELVIVVLLLGILIAVALPKYLNLSGSTLDAAGAAAVDAVKSAYTAATDEARGHPTTAQVVEAMKGENVLTYVTGSGFEVKLKESATAKVTIPALTSVTSDCSNAASNGAATEYVCGLGTPTMTH